MFAAVQQNRRMAVVVAKQTDACKPWTLFSFSWPRKAQPVESFIFVQLSCILGMSTCKKIDFLLCRPLNIYSVKSALFNG